MRTMIVLVSISLIIAGAAALAHAAPERTDTIQGTIKDALGRPLPGAT